MFRIVYDDGAVFVTREGVWRNLPDTGIQIVEYIQNQTILARISGYDIYFWSPSKFGGYVSDSSIYDFTLGTKPDFLDDLTFPLRLAPGLSVTRSDISAALDGYPGIVYSVAADGRISNSQQIPMYPKFTVPSVAERTPLKTGTEVSDLRAASIRLASVRYKLWLAERLGSLG